MRFGPPRQDVPLRLEAKRRGLSREQHDAYADIKAKWEAQYHKKASKKQYTNEELLRFCIFCDFRAGATLGLLSKTRTRHMNLLATDLAAQLHSKTLFPCPGLKTSEGSSVFYMRPSRYWPRQTPVAMVIDNLIYVLDRMARQDVDNQGVAFMANMNDWTMANFNHDYCFKFMMTLQGRMFPAKVNLFLIINPPGWFGKIWAIMKPMFSSTFRKKVHMIKDTNLSDFMAKGYNTYLPDDLKDGRVNTDELVRDFVSYQHAFESATGAVEKALRRAHDEDESDGASRSSAGNSATDANSGNNYRGSYLQWKRSRKENILRKTHQRRDRSSVGGTSSHHRQSDGISSLGDGSSDYDDMFSDSFAEDDDLTASMMTEEFVEPTSLRSGE